MKKFCSILLTVAMGTVFYSSWSHAGKTEAISNHQVTQKAALKNVLELNVGMFKLYDQALEDFQKGFLSNHPLILGLFSGDGGKMILYRPGKEAEQAPSVPVIYQILKSTGHSTMAISQIALQYLNKNNATGWREPLENYLVQNNKALKGLEVVPMDESWRAVVARILKATVHTPPAAVRLG